MAKDYYLYKPCDKLMLGYNLTHAEANELKNELDTECPSEAGQSVIYKASDDYKAAYERMAAHMTDW